LSIYQHHRPVLKQWFYQTQSNFFWIKNLFTRFMNSSYLGNIQFYFIILHRHPPLRLLKIHVFQYQGC
jgi:hypothetical protein